MSVTHPPPKDDEDIQDFSHHGWPRSTQCACNPACLSCSPSCRHSAPANAKRKIEAASADR
jgi:hypothetical protein